MEHTTKGDSYFPLEDGAEWEYYWHNDQYAYGIGVQEKWSLFGETTKPLDLNYNVSILDEYRLIKINCKVGGLVPKALGLQMEYGWDVEQKFPDSVFGLTAKDFEGNGLPIFGEHRIRNGVWLVKNIPPEGFEYSYFILPRQNEVFVERSPALSQDFCFVFGEAIFITPSASDFTQINVHFEVPQKWNIATSWGTPSDETSYQVHNSDMLKNAIIGLGDYRLYTKQILGGEMMFAVRGEYPLSDDELLQFVTGYFEYYADLFGEYPRERYLVMFNQGVSGGNVLSYGLSVLVSDELANLSADEARQELFNNTTIPRGIFNIWHAGIMHGGDYLKGKRFLKGFSEYYAMLVAERLRPKRTPEEIQAAKQFVTSKLNDFYFGYQQNPEGLPGFGRENEVHYYKGAMIALMLDAAIRKKANGDKTFHDFMKAMYERFGRRGYAYQDIFALASEFTGEDMTSFHEKYIVENDILPVEDALAQMGYQVGEDGMLHLEDAEMEKR